MQGEENGSIGTMTYGKCRDGGREVAETKYKFKTCKQNLKWKKKKKFFFFNSSICQLLQYNQQNKKYCNAQWHFWLDKNLRCNLILTKLRKKYCVWSSGSGVYREGKKNTLCINRAGEKSGLKNPPKNV